MIIELIDHLQLFLLSHDLLIQVFV